MSLPQMAIGTPYNDGDDVCAYRLRKLRPRLSFDSPASTLEYVSLYPVRHAQSHRCRSQDVSETYRKKPTHRHVFPAPYPGRFGSTHEISRFQHSVLASDVKAESSACSLPYACCIALLSRCFD